MTPSQLSELLLHTLPHPNMPICITGRPGIGKTDIVKQSAAALGYQLEVFHPAVDDPIDYKGLPGVENGKAEFLPYGNLRKLMEADRPLVAFFDDLGQGSEAVQKALMQLLLAREINGKKISDHVRFVAATNGKEHKAGVTGLLEPVKSRFASIVELDINKDQWVDWAIQNDVAPTVIAFIEWRENLLHDFKPTKDMTNSVSPRTLANLSNLVKIRLPDDVRPDSYHGAIGHAAIEYTAFESMASRLHKPAEIFEKPESISLPTRQNPDVCYATAVGLALAVNHDTMPALVKYMNRFDDQNLLEYAVLCMRNITRRDRELVTNCMEWHRWAAKHKDFIL